MYWCAQLIIGSRPDDMYWCAKLIIGSRPDDMHWCLKAGHNAARLVGCCHVMFAFREPAFHQKVVLSQSQTVVMSLLSQSPAMLSQSPAMLAESPAMLAQSPAMLSQSPAMFSQSPAMQHKVCSHVSKHKVATCLLQSICDCHPQNARPC